MPFPPARLAGYAFAALLFGSPAAAQPTLFSPAAPPPRAERLAPEQGHATRARYVRLHVETLATLTAGRPHRLAVELFDGRRFTYVADEVARKGAQLTLRGHVAERPSDQGTLVVVDGAAVGRFVVEGEVYLLAYAGAGRHVLYAYDEPAPRATCGTPEAPAHEPEGVGSSGAPDPTSEGEPLDLLVLYTPSVAAAVGADGLPPLLAAFLDDLNASFATAGTAHTARLVATREIPYDEDPERSLAVDVDRLVHRNDGHLDAAHEWRDEAYADAVVLVVEEGADYCGFASIMSRLERAFAPRAFAVVKRSCGYGDLVFAHEVGHLLGLRHDYAVDPSKLPAPYAHGFVNPTPTEGAPFRTVMAYPDQCRDAGFECPPVASFSSVEATLGDEALGEAATADAARLLAESVPLAAGFRDPSTPPPSPAPIEVVVDEGETTHIHLVDLLEAQLGEPVALVRVDPPTVGALSHLAGGAAYTPPTGFTGPVAFGYVLADEVGQLAEGRVDVLVAPLNDAPVAPYIYGPSGSTPIALDAGSEDVLEVVWRPGTDADGDSLSYTWQLTGTLSAEGWQAPLLEVAAGHGALGVTVPIATLARTLDASEVPEGEERVLYHRAVVSDGVLQTSGTPRRLLLARPSPAAPAALAFALWGPYPNPTSGQVHLRLDLPRETVVALSLYDALGRRVGVEAAVVPAGAGRRAAFDVGSLAAGLYVYRLHITYGGITETASGRLAVLP